MCIFVESIGVNKAKAVLEEAELLIVVLDGSEDLGEQDKAILELTKDKKRIGSDFCVWRISFPTKLFCQTRIYSYSRLYRMISLKDNPTMVSTSH